VLLGGFVLLKELDLVASAHLNYAVIQLVHNNLQISTSQAVLSFLLIGMRYNPRDTRLIRNAGFIYLRRGDMPLALEMFDRGLRLNPTDLLLHFYNGNALYQTGRDQKAITEWSQANAGRYFYNQGKSLAGKGLLREAISSYEISSKLEPDFGGTYTALGDLYIAEGRKLEAIEMYQTALSKEGLNSLEKTLIQARVVYYLGDISGSLRLYRLLVAQTPPCIPQNSKQFQETAGLRSEALRMIGVIEYWNVGNQVAGRQALREAVECQPDYVWNYIHLGDTYRNQQRYHESAYWYEKAAAAIPHSEVPYLYLGINAANQGLFSAALSYLFAAQEINADNAEVWYWIGLVYWDMGNLPLAELYLKHALQIAPRSEYSQALREVERLKK